MSKLDLLRHLPWWEAKGNPNNKRIKPDYLSWDNKDIRQFSKKTAKPRETWGDGELAYWYFNRSFVLEKIRRLIIKPLREELTKEELHQLLDEAYDFDFEEYKRTFYQTHSNDNSGG